jgi:hypothetical protein
MKENARINSNVCRPIPTASPSLMLNLNDSERRPQAGAEALRML